MSDSKDSFNAFARQNRAYELAFSRWPSLPLATDDYESGTYRQPRSRALTLKHIEINVPGCLSVLLFDMDIPGAALVWERVLLPSPSWIAVNPANSHAHYAYVLDRPVYRISERHQPAVQHALTVRACLQARLGSDKAYTERLTKNPLSPSWNVTSSGRTYDLSELMEWIPDAEYREMRTVLWNRSKSRDQVRSGYGVSRKVTLFEDLRRFAYQNWAEIVAENCAEGSGLLLRHAKQLNTGVNGKLPLADHVVEKTAISVTQWVKTQFNPEANATSLADRQRRRGKKSGEVRRQKREMQVLEAIASIKAGGNELVTQAEIARRCGCTRQNISSRYKHLVQPSLEEV